MIYMIDMIKNDNYYDHDIKEEILLIIVRAKNDTKKCNRLHSIVLKITAYCLYRD
jgi:hypothetical protein